jgi:hypothetical protein
MATSADTRLHLINRQNQKAFRWVLIWALFGSLAVVVGGYRALGSSIDGPLFSAMLLPCFMAVYAAFSFKSQDRRNIVHRAIAWHVNKERQYSGSLHYLCETLLYAEVDGWPIHKLLVEFYSEYHSGFPPREYEKFLVDRVRALNETMSKIYPGEEFLAEKKELDAILNTPSWKSMLHTKEFVTAVDSTDLGSHAS